MALENTSETEIEAIIKRLKHPLNPRSFWRGIIIRVEIRTLVFILAIYEQLAEMSQYKFVRL